MEYIPTPNLLRIMVQAKADNEMRAWVREAVLLRIEQLRKNREEDKLEAMRVLFKAVDEHYAESDQQTTCKKGCNFCCRMNVDASMDEAALIIQYCKDHGIAINKKALRDRLSVPFLEVPWSKHAACMFLKDGECSIYPVRPLNCRTYYAQSDPDRCNPEKYRFDAYKPVIIIDRDIEILQTAFFNLVLEEAGRLEEMLLAQLS